jgi:hypothetical protein
VDGARIARWISKTSQPEASVLRPVALAVLVVKSLVAGTKAALLQGLLREGPIPMSEDGWPAVFITHLIS